MSAEQPRKQGKHHNLQRSARDRARGRYERQRTRTTANKRRKLERHCAGNPNDLPSQARLRTGAL